MLGKRRFQVVCKIDIKVTESVVSLFLTRLSVRNCKYTGLQVYETIIMRFKIAVTTMRTDNHREN